MFGVLGLFAAAALLHVKEKFDLHGPLLLIFPIVALATSIFLYHIHFANEQNKAIARESEDIAAKLLNPPEGFNVTLTLPPYINKWKWLKTAGWALLWQIVILISSSVFTAIIFKAKF